MEKGPHRLALEAWVRDRIENHGLKNLGVTWGPDADKLTEEERCKYLLEVFTAPKTPVNVKDIDSGREKVDVREFVKGLE